ncbi:MAG: sigma-70 family RNA polymerase sigma factor [Balneola sp.]
MKQDTQQIWDSFKESLFYFILKRVKDEDVSWDILQEVFIKIHLNLHQVKDPSKIHSWAFQITRNQVAEHFRKTTNMVALDALDQEYLSDEIGADETNLCCFEHLINELPQKYSDVLTLINVQGKKQKEAANELSLSLSNLKTRVYRAKELLKQKFIDCCRFTLNNKGLLVGEQDCQRCSCASC